MIIEGIKPREQNKYAAARPSFTPARSGDPVAIAAHTDTSDALDQALADFASSTATRTHATTPA